MVIDLFIPAFIAAVIIFGLIKRIPVFDTFISGAEKGFKTLYSLAPTLVGLIIAVNMLKESGASNLISGAVSPLAEKLGFPEQIVPMVLLRPVSGGGSTALLTGIYKECGPDSFAGMVASVLAGSTETTFYAIAVYFSSVGIKKIRHTLIAALAADFTAALTAVITVKFFFTNI